MHRIADSYVGGRPVARIYLGQRLVWQRTDYRLTIPFTIPFTMVAASDPDE